MCPGASEPAWCTLPFSWGGFLCANIFKFLCPWMYVFVLPFIWKWGLTGGVSVAEADKAVGEGILGTLQISGRGMHRTPDWAWVGVVSLDFQQLPSGEGNAQSFSICWFLWCKCSPLHQATEELENSHSGSHEPVEATQMMMGQPQHRH